VKVSSLQLYFSNIHLYFVVIFNTANVNVSKVNSNETGADKKVGSILNLLLREGGVPAGGGGR
ncbi:hypothetical protein KQP65_25925, partial [Bacteroides thetaiotaomicron]|uniref:hypothetical protein n=3 Tax=Bacteroides thetaiotaomicron TaxID=818 RepID=UPI00221FDBC2